MGWKKTCECYSNSENETNIDECTDSKATHLKTTAIDNSRANADNSNKHVVLPSNQEEKYTRDDLTMKESKNTDDQIKSDLEGDTCTDNHNSTNNNDSKTSRRPRLVKRPSDDLAWKLSVSRKHKRESRLREIREVNMNDTDTVENESVNKNNENVSDRESEMLMDTKKGC